MGQNRYKYLRIWATRRGILITTPHKEVVEWVMSKVREHVPHAQLEVVYEARYRIHKLDGNDVDIAIWILGELCRNGWEPFAITTLPTDTPAFRWTGVAEAIHLRFSYHSEE